MCEKFWRKSAQLTASYCCRPLYEIAGRMGQHKIRNTSLLGILRARTPFKCCEMERHDFNAVKALLSQFYLECVAGIDVYWQIKCNWWDKTWKSLDSYGQEWKDVNVKIPKSFLFNLHFSYFFSDLWLYFYWTRKMEANRIKYINKRDYNNIFLQS